MSRRTILTAAKISLAVLIVIALFSLRGVVEDTTTSIFAPAATIDPDQFERMSSWSIGLYELIVVSTVIGFTIATRPRDPILACTCLAIGIWFTNHIGDVFLMTIESFSKALQHPGLQLFSHEPLRFASNILPMIIVTVVLILTCRRGFEKRSETVQSVPQNQ
ncbi:hypothetical protein AB1L42_07945 [Thalassoglobus sp. JC818]|uniref:hypothetical protein n=1 Tax=Thalassoglobus sp. JC818 TaxID=3232136 RepID=UPI00345AF269